MRGAEKAARSPERHVSRHCHRCPASDGTRHCATVRNWRSLDHVSPRQGGAFALALLPRVPKCCFGGRACRALQYFRLKTCSHMVPQCWIIPSQIFGFVNLEGALLSLLVCFLAIS